MSPSLWWEGLGHSAWLRVLGDPVAGTGPIVDRARALKYGGCVGQLMDKAGSQFFWLYGPGST